MGKRKYNALMLQMAGEKLEANLIDFIKKSKMDELCYSYKSRVKTQERLIEKTKRKKEKEDKPNYNLKDITDVLGIRFISLFRLKLPDIFEKMISLIQHNEAISPNPFSKGNIKEIIYYAVNPEHDEVAEMIRRKARNLGVEHLLQISDSKDYTSIHIVAYAEDRVDIHTDYQLPVEIQMRTVFEDAWGEIDHRYGYVLKSGKEIGEPVHNAEFVSNHLSALKKFTDACAEYADCIFKEAQNDASSALSYGRVISVKDDSIIKEFKKMKIDNELIEEYERNRNMRISAECKSTKQPKSIYLNAAERFKELIEKTTQKQLETKNKPKYKVFIFFSRMNEAACLLSTGLQESIHNALTIYTDLLGTYSEYPLLHFRLGQAYSRLGYFEESVNSFISCKKLINKKAKKAEKNTKFNFKYRSADIIHIKNHLPTIWGVQLWQKSQKEESLNGKLKYLNKAISKTEELKGTSYQENRTKMLNNVLYFKIEKSKVLSEFNKKTPKDLKTEITSILKKVERTCKDDMCNDLDYVDTLANGYFVTGNYQQAKKYLEKLLELAFDSRSNGSHTSKVLLDIVHEAYHMNKLIDMNGKQKY